MRNLLLAPVLVAQGLMTALRATRLPEAVGPRAGHVGEGPPLRLLILGDSSAAGVGVNQQSEALSGQLVSALSARYAVDWHLRAKSGATTASTLRALEEAPLPVCDVAVVALGVNDVKNGVREAVWRQNLEALIGILEAAGARHIYLSGLPPMGEFPLLPNPLRRVLGERADHFDAVLQEVAQDHGGVHLGFDLPFDPAMMAADGFHPGPEVYRLWAERLAEQIRADWQS